MRDGRAYHCPPVKRKIDRQENGMSREEFLRGLEEALKGEVPASVVRDNLNYYSSYLSQELAKGRTMDEIVEEIGEPRIVARTIIDAAEAAGDGGNGYGAYEDGSYSQGSYEQGYDQNGYGGSYRGSYEDSSGKGNPWDRWFRSGHIHYIDLNKWYWKLLFAVIAVFFLVLVLSIVSGIFSLLFRFAGPILLILFLYWFIKSLRR